MNTNPLGSLHAISVELKKLIEFAENQANNPALTPEQKQQVEVELKKHDFSGLKKQLDESEQKLKEKMNGNTAK